MEFQPSDPAWTTPAEDVIEWFESDEVDFDNFGEITDELKVRIMQYAMHDAVTNARLLEKIIMSQMAWYTIERRDPKQILDHLLHFTLHYFPESPPCIDPECTLYNPEDAIKWEIDTSEMVGHLKKVLEHHEAKARSQAAPLN